MTTARALSRTRPTLDRRERVSEGRLGSRPLEPLEMLARVGLEVEVELRYPLLDDSPHRLAEVGHEAHEDERRDLRGSRLAEVFLQQRAVLVLAELVVDGEVREIEEDVPHARVLPVDDADARAVVDEVGIEEVVVARPQRLRAASVLDLVRALLRDVEA